MNSHRIASVWFGACIAFILNAGIACADIDGITGTIAGGTTSFSLTAKDGYILTPEPGSLYVWGYADGAGALQYPGPTLIVAVGQTVQITLTNTLTVPVSLVVPGHLLASSGGVPGLITQEAAANGGTVAYSFVAANPGTYLYHSGTQQELQIEMGLVGALVVRSATVGQAYGAADTAYDREFLFLQTEMDPTVHELVSSGRLSEVDNTKWWSTYWFLNGRCAPDTMLARGTMLFPNQPYNCMPMMYPGEKMLLRLVNAGRELHPFHTHGNHMRLLAQDGRLLSSTGASADLSRLDFTTSVPPGGTTDAIFTWTGEKLGWDIYGHQPGDLQEPNEYAPDHGKPFPVILPDAKSLTFGTMFSGSPFLGAAGVLPPGQGGFNPTAGFVYMWHSHKEKELTTNNVFPGGMMTMLIIVPPGVPMTMP